MSAASVWEIAIKHRLGKLPVEPALCRDRMLAYGAEVLAVSDTHVIKTAALPRHHDDPFDRMLIAQARVEKTTNPLGVKGAGEAGAMGAPLAVINRHRERARRAAHRHAGDAKQDLRSIEAAIS